MYYRIAMSEQIDLKIIVEEDPETGWLTATCPVLPGCVTQGKTSEELIANMKEAIVLWLEVEQEKRLSAEMYKSIVGSGAIQRLILNI